MFTCCTSTQVQILKPPAPLHSGASQEVVLRGLSDFLSWQGLLTDMYAAFDCCVSSPNLFEKVVLLVCKLLALPQPPSRRLHTHTTHMLASEALLSLLKGMSVHISAAPTHTHAAAATLSCRAAQLSAAKLAKRKLAAAAEAFNREPKALKKGVPLLQDLGIIYTVERGGGGALG